METGPIRVFGELIPDRILARAAEELLQESNEHGDRADCARYIVECAAHHVRYPDSTQSFHSTVCLDAELEFSGIPLKQNWYPLNSAKGAMD